MAHQLRRRFLPRTALDVGAGTGLIVEALRLGGVDAKGVELSQDAIDKAHDFTRPHLTQLDATTQALPFPNDSIDLVTSIEVFEHLPDHKHIFGEILRVLRPGGHFFLQTPKPGSDEADDPTHISVKPKREWAKLAQAAGFEVADDELLEFEHELPMAGLGRKLGAIRSWAPVRRYVVKSGTRSLFRKPGSRAK